ncbi:hypothetical protein OAI49_01900 [Synechococcus sp. AH-558-M21]|nr:hypothetical protein [Synechococcus sp. AH-558-M21]
MTVKICFLHLGFHKTATTSIQLTCRNNSELLLKKKIETPRFKNEKNRISGNHTGQLRNIFDVSNETLYAQIKGEESKPEQSNSLEGHIFEFLRLLRSKNNIFLSGEGIPLFRKESLKRMVMEIEAHGFQIYPFALVRSPYAYLNSALQQTIKGGRHYPWIGLSEDQLQSLEMIEKSQKLPNTVTSIKRLQSIFSQSIHFYPFSRASKDPEGPVAFVLKNILKQDNLEDFEMTNANQSLSNFATRIQNVLNKEIQHTNNNDLKKLIHRQNDQLNFEKFLLTSQEFNAIESYFKEIQASMNKLLGPDFTEETIQFSSNKSLQDINQSLIDLAQSLYQFATTNSKQKPKRSKH